MNRIIYQSNGAIGTCFLYVIKPVTAGKQSILISSLAEITMKVFDNSPTAAQVITSRETVDGKRRYGFFTPELAKERKEWAKLTFLVSKFLVFPMFWLMRCKTFGMITVLMFLFLSIYFGEPIIPDSSFG